MFLLQIKLLICIVVLIIFGFGLALALGNNETDRVALLALKDQLVDDGGALTSWNSSLHICEWQGVRCGRKQKRVIRLKLSGMQLVGSISPSIGNLSFIREVNLSNNKIQGIIPIEFGHLSRLRFLNLSHNNLYGNIPMELTNCSNLQLIDLNYNNLSGKIPFGLGDSMKNLTGLSVSHNNLIGKIPSSFGNLSSLADLQLEDNHLEGNIPNSFGRLSNLKRLSIGENNLYGTLPSSIYNLSSITYIRMTGNKYLSGQLSPEIGSAFPKLEILYIGDNQFNGSIPRSLTNISTLKRFDIHSNGFTGSVPENMGNLKNLEIFAIDYNHLGTGNGGDLDFLSSLTNCSMLKILAVHDNSLSGVLPISVANLSTKLEYLIIAGNRISGSIPEGIGNLVNLTRINMWENLITGEIPTSVGKLQNLGTFDVSVNRLSGTIPSTIGNLSQLLKIYLNDNNLEGRVPLTLRNCKSMEIVDLSRNKLSGSVTEELIAGFESLTNLNLSQNSFSGMFPSGISNCKHLVELRVDNNDFSGEIPKELGLISSLQILQMQGNHFQGSIPLSFGSLKGIENLDLSDNNLSGTIPVELEKLPFLVSLNLSFNKLEGEVPQEGVFKNTSSLSIIGNQELCGGIPEIQLPKCSKKGNVLSTTEIVVIIIGIVASIFVVLLLIICWRKCLGREIIPVSWLPAGYLRVSYKDLLQATNGFASSNFIGEGSFGSVYKGVLHQVKNPVAVKVLNLQNLGAIKSFMVESAALSKIRHRNLVKLITSCSSMDYKGGDFKALVLEFMPNGSLESWLHDDHDQHHLSFGQMVDIAIDVANALDYLHHHCETVIVHRDLKPTNVLLDDDMVAHVSDFGMAKLLSRATGNLTNEQASSGVNGTIGYLAPEYGMGGTASPKGDIYSYGILLLEMVTGKRPTDDSFRNGSNLHNLCKRALPEQLEEIVDFRLLEQTNDTSQKNECGVGEQNIDGEMWECLASFTKVGVACSLEAPIERMKIEDAITELLVIKAKLHARNYFNF